MNFILFMKRQKSWAYFYKKTKHRATTIAILSLYWATKLVILGRIEVLFGINSFHFGVFLTFKLNCKHQRVEGPAEILLFQFHSWNVERSPFFRIHLCTSTVHMFGIMQWSPLVENVNKKETFAGNDQLVKIQLYFCRVHDNPVQCAHTRRLYFA